MRHRIKQLIDAEAVDAMSCPTTRSSTCCSDDGIDIARRTVAKYREAMRIPSSVQRRREKQMAVAAVARFNADARNGGNGAGPAGLA